MFVIEWSRVDLWSKVVTFCGILVASPRKISELVSGRELVG